jgi:hypothetical protein
LTTEVDGKFSRSFNAWPDFGPFVVGLGRWLLGGDPPQGIRATVEREGGQGIVRVELDPDRKRGGPEDIRSAMAAIVPPGDTGTSTPQRYPLAWVGEDTLEARFPIQKTGIYLGAVDIGNKKVLPLAPLSLPYSPEFEPRVNANEGVKTLAEMARVSGGAERTAWDDVFNASRLRDRQVRDLVLPLVLAVLLLHLGEIAGRRLLWFAAAQTRMRSVRLRQRPVEVVVTSQPTEAAPVVVPPLPPNADRPRSLRCRAQRRKRRIARGRSTVNLWRANERKWRIAKLKSRNPKYQIGPGHTEAPTDPAWV